jgi:hypothetical protein
MEKVTLLHVLRKKCDTVVLKIDTETGLIGGKQEVAFFLETNLKIQLVTRDLWEVQPLQLCG